MDDLRHVEAGSLADAVEAWPVVEHDELARGWLFTFVRDRVTTPGGEVMTREFVEHPGAVAVVALDAEERVVLVRQYRHPVRRLLYEIPAGLLDIGGEDYVTAAQRELAEETGLAAGTWSVLVDLFTSPGVLGETLRVYLARDLTPVGRPAGFELHGEEAEMEVCVARLDDLADAVLDGRLGNPALCTGVLAAVAARSRGWAGLRRVDAPWPGRGDRP